MIAPEEIKKPVVLRPKTPEPVVEETKIEVVEESKVNQTIVIEKVRPPIAIKLKLPGMGAQ